MMSKRDEGRIYYDSLEVAVVGWGRWAGEAWKVAEARRVLDRLIELHGPPSGEVGETAFYSRPGYVNVLWHGRMGLQLHPRFIRSRIRLDPDWVDDNGAPGAGQWFKLPYPGHLRPARGG